MEEYTIKLHIVNNTTKVKDTITDIVKGDNFFDALVNMYNLHKNNLINNHISRISIEPKGYRHVITITKKKGK